MEMKNMKIFRTTASALLVILLFASIGFAARDGLQVTIYNDNRALVNDHRVIPLKKGLNEIKLTDVSARIDPTSVHVAWLTDPEGTRVLEQSFEYDLVSTSRLLEKYLDRQIKVVARDGTAYKGTLIGITGGVIIRNATGGTTALKNEYLREITFPSLPNGLITRPTLMWLVDAAKSGKHKTELIYLTEGLNWHAEYILSLSKAGKNADLSSWITLDNRTGMTFTDAHTKLVAGSLHRAPPPRRSAPYQALRKEAGTVTESQVQPRSLFEYHLYDIKRPFTLRNNENKQIQFLTGHQIPVIKRFVLDNGRSYTGSPDNRQKGKAEVQILFVNNRKSGLGIPLPAGICRIFKSDVDESRQLIGEDRIKHTSTDERVILTAGKAFDVVGERVKTSQKVLGKRSRKETWRIEVRNHKREKVPVHVVERLNRSGSRTEWEIVSESRHHTKKSANAVEYLVKVPAEGKTEITYSVIFRW
ncbi:MAG: hypothetical protein B1H13_08400 [Desulfobacteraceae bacterium 4484_190.3]|nr:MAG: hypothetical protein B1H13_08400 [Desulfobacteraceae bacterium 4484_190.3]